LIVAKVFGEFVRRVLEITPRLDIRFHGPKKSLAFSDMAKL
jgi:hypothetical protein